MGYKIKQIRESLKMSQTELAEKSSVSRTIINGLETGKITVITTETLRKIAAALNASVGDIFFD